MGKTYDLKCERCGASFTSEQPDARFCSHLCTSLVGSKRKKNAEQRLDNHCTIRVSLLSEINELINDKRKRI